MAKKMYFGSREFMTWIKCPSIDAGMSTVGWQSTSQYLNGGAGVRRSNTGHKEYDYVWPMASHKDADVIKNFAGGVYGEGLIYFLDPFAMKTNLLPQHWASPRLAKGEGPSLVIGRRPTLSPTLSNGWMYPTQSAVYQLREGDTFASIYIPVPPGHTFHFGAHGSSTETAQLEIRPHYESNSLIEDGPGLYMVPPELIADEPQLYIIGSEFTETAPGSGLYALTEAAAQPVPMLSANTNQRTNVSIPLVTGVTITLSGVGFLTLAGLIAQVRPDGEPVPNGGFLGGEGHSGCQFESFPTVVGYSSPQALDKQSVTARLIETGAWL